MNDSERRHLAARLTDLAKQLNTIDDTNTHDHDFVRAGLLAIRAGLAMINDGDHARRNVSDWAARGFPSGGNDNPRTFDPNDPDGDITLTSVEAGASGSDHWERQGTMLDHERRSIADNAYAIEHRIATITEVVPPEQRRTKLLATTALDIDCANPHCDNKITGIGDDRPRRGRCPRCFKYLTRTGRDWTSRSEPCPHPETAGHP